MYSQFMMHGQKNIKLQYNTVLRCVNFTIEPYYYVPYSRHSFFLNIDLLL